MVYQAAVHKYQVENNWFEIADMLIDGDPMVPRHLETSIQYPFLFFRLENCVL